MIESSQPELAADDLLFAQLDIPNNHPIQQANLLPTQPSEDSFNHNTNYFQKILNNNPNEN